MLALVLASCLFIGCGDQAAQDDFNRLEQKLDAIEETVDEIEKEWEDLPEQPEGPRFTSVEFDPDASSYSAAETHSMDQVYKELNALRQSLLIQEEELQERERILDAGIRELASETKALARRKNELKDKIQAYVADFERVSESEEKNLKKLSETFLKLSPAGAVELIKQYQQEGKLDQVVKMLEFLKPDEIAVIFDEMMKNEDDEGTKLVQTITERLRLIYREPVLEN